MRISTRQLYDVVQGSLARGANEAYSWQRKLASGQRIHRASEDAASAGRAVVLATRQSRIDMLKGNQDYARMSLSELDTALDGMQRQVDVLKEVSIQAANGALDSVGYAGLRARAEQALQALRNFAGSKDTSGRDLFGEDMLLEVQTGFSVRTLINREEVLGPADNDLLKLADDIVNALGEQRPPKSTEIEALDNGGSLLILTRTKVGLDAETADDARAAVEATELGLAEERSGLLDTDIAQGVSGFSRANTLLEVARSLFSRIDSIGLFGMLK